MGMSVRKARWRVLSTRKRDGKSRTIEIIIMKG